MTVIIHPSKKLEYARDQYYAEAGGFTLLRLTLGTRGGQPGGAIKTATASDFGAAPIYSNQEALTEALCRGVESLGGKTQNVSVALDGKGRQFAEISLPDSHKDFIETLKIPAERIKHDLGLKPDGASDSGYSESHDLYDDLCHADGEPVYLSDSVNFGEHGQLFE